MKRARQWRLWPTTAPVALAVALTLHGSPTPAFERVGSATIDGSAWTLSADSSEPGDEPQQADDQNASTVWESAAGDPLPQGLSIDTGQVQQVGGLQYTPPPLGASTAIGDYRIDGSPDGSQWQQLATGTWADDGTVKTVTFATAQVRYVRLVGLSSAGGQVAVAEVALSAPAPPPPPHPQWAIAVDSAVPGSAGTKAIDGNPTSEWESEASAFPHVATLDTGAASTWSGLRYTPPQDRTGTIGRYTVATSLDGSSWTTVARGELADDRDTKTVTFAPRSARFVRLTALSEAGGRGTVTAAAELDLVPGSSMPSVPTSLGRWTPPVNFPIVPAAVALLPNGKVLAWSADNATTYGGPGGLTHTVVYDPVSGAMAHVKVTNTGQDMFCPGIAMLPDGRVAVFGGHFTAARISVYDAAKDHWTPARPMVLTRGYESAVTQADGKVFVIGGSWGDQDTVKNGEVWSASTGSRLLSGAPVAPMLTADRQGTYRQDNHGWLFTWGTRIFQAGPSRHMNWYTTSGTGGVTPAGLRGTDGDAMNGAAAMFSPGKILTVGGAPDYTGSPATSNANLVSITGGKAVVTALPAMHFPRSFASAVVLPDGKVFVSGGMQLPKTFSDDTAVLTPELWNPATRTFSDMAPMQVPRTYHSEALLLPDGRVFVGGGGLCGLIGDCVDVNHADAQIWSPPYLFTSTGAPASRPMITAAPTSAYAGHTITVRTNTRIAAMVLVRASAVTHSVNTDQRRIPVAFTGTPARGYALTLPADRGVLVPGAYLLFALNPKGVPSVAKVLVVH